jgi:biopolymer transport protein ExbD
MAGPVGARGPHSEINVTPLVDIVLVLLIIFMVITPLLAKNIPIEVPQKAELAEPPDEIKDQVVLKLFADGHIELNKTAVTAEALGALIEETFKNRKEKVMFFEGEDDAVYGHAVTLMDVAKGAGVVTLGIMTPSKEPEMWGPPAEGIPEEAPAPAE